MRATSIALAVLVMVVVAAPAAAKMPGFDVSIDPEEPVAGEPTTVTVELDDPIGLESLSGLVGFFRADNVDPPFNPLVANLDLVSGSTYTGIVVFPEATDWVMVSFPDRTGWSTDELAPIYPGPRPVTVVEASQTSGLAAVLVVLVGVALALLGRQVSS